MRKSFLSMATTLVASILVPGVGNQLFAVIGRWVPALAEWVMQKTLWEKLKG